MFSYTETAFIRHF